MEIMSKCHDLGLVKYAIRCNLKGTRYEKLFSALIRFLTGSQAEVWKEAGIRSWGNDKVCRVAFDASVAA